MIEDGTSLESFDIKPALQSNDKTSAKFDLTIIILVIGIFFTVIKKRRIISAIGICIAIFVLTYSSILFFIFAIIALLAMFYSISDEIVYWPSSPTDSRQSVRLPSSIGLPCENLFLYAKDGTKLHAVLVKQDLNDAPTFIYLHGNAGNIGHRLENVFDLYRYLKVNILMLEYRGFGLSEGKPSEQGLYLDAEAAVSYIRTRTDIDPDKIVLFGRSLGGAVAIDCSAIKPEIKNRISCLIVENTFTSIPEMAKKLFSEIKILSSLPLCFHKNKFNSKIKMCKIAAPTLFLSGQEDSLVPPQMMNELYLGCSSSHKCMYTFKNGTHNETWRCNGYYDVIAQFLDEIYNVERKRTETRPLLLPPSITCVSHSLIM